MIWAGPGFGVRFSVTGVKWAFGRWPQQLRNSGSCSHRHLRSSQTILELGYSLDIDIYRRSVIPVYPPRHSKTDARLFLPQSLENQNKVRSIEAPTQVTVIRWMHCPAGRQTSWKGNCDQTEDTANDSMRGDKIPVWVRNYAPALHVRPAKLRLMISSAYLHLAQERKSPTPPRANCVIEGPLLDIAAPNIDVHCHMARDFAYPISTWHTVSGIHRSSIFRCYGVYRSSHFRTTQTQFAAAHWVCKSKSDSLSSGRFLICFVILQC